MATPDEADMAMVGEEKHAIDPAVEARVVGKIDMFLIPTMVTGNGLVYYDKAILGSAVLFAMTRDLDLSVTDNATSPPTVDTRRLSWATSLFYFGMLAGLYSVPHDLCPAALQHGPDPGSHCHSLGGGGGICMLTAAVTSWQGLYVQRFLLGFVESVVPTGFMCIVSSYDTQSELSVRQSWWYSSNGSFVPRRRRLELPDGFAHITGGALRPWQYIIYLLDVVPHARGEVRGRGAAPARPDHV